MIENLKVRLWIIISILVLGVIWFLPNIVNVKAINWLPQKKINYGLDIQGGLHLVMGLDIDGSVKEKSIRQAEDLKKFLEKEKVGVMDSKLVSGQEGQFILVLKEDVDKAKKLIDQNYTNVLHVIKNENKELTIEFLDTYLIGYKKEVVSQSIETIRNRIDEFGVAEPSITSQGENRILIQLPGIEDATRAKELINKTARLDFMLVSEKVKPDELQKWVADAEQAGGYNLSQLKYSDYVKRINEDLKSKIPEKTVVYFEKDKNAITFEAGKVAFLLTTDTGLSGDDLRDASITFDEYGTPEVSLSFNPAGTQKFAELTGANVDKYMAIVLDKIVKSAPVIKTRIPNGQARISLGAAGRNSKDLLDEAKMISMTLKAGALPASLEQLEERTVGPSLGRDAIQKGQMASIIAGVLVIIFMLFWYKSFGLVADVTLMINILLLLSLLTTLGATLTLPGVAGIALTMGMAVDANVIIFERIKEELAKGAELQAAIREGFHRAFSSIFDGNVTTLATCIILMYFGTGPVRGFAVSLTCGLTASMFTAIFVTRTILDVLVGKWKLKLSI